MPSEYSEEYGCTVYQVKVKAETWSDTFERMDFARAGAGTARNQKERQED